MTASIVTKGPCQTAGGPQVPGLIESTNYFIVDKTTGKVVERLSTSGRRVLRDKGLYDFTVSPEGGEELKAKHRLSDRDMIEGLESGRFQVKSQEEVLAGLDKKKCGVGITGGGDCAGIADFLASLQQNLKPELTMLGVRNAGKGLCVPPEQFQSKLIIVEGLAAEDFEGQSSTPYGSARVDPLKEDKDRINTGRNIGGYGFFYGTGGNDHLALLERIAGEFPKMVVVGTFKSIDGDGCVKTIPFSLGDMLDPGEINKGFKTLGLEVSGRFTQEGVETRVDGETRTWTLTTDAKQEWIIQYDGKKDEVKVYEKREKSLPPKARVRGKVRLTTTDGEREWKIPPSKEEEETVELDTAELEQTLTSPILRRTLEAKTEINGSITTMYDMPCQMLGFQTAVLDYQKAIWAAAMNADTHDQWHVVETFGRNSTKLAYEAARRHPKNFDKLPPEEQRKIMEYGPSIMILAAEKQVTFRTLAAEAKKIHDARGNVVVVVVEGFMPPELQYEMNRLAKNETFKTMWTSKTLDVEKIPGLIEVADENDPRNDLKKILEDEELAAHFAKTVWGSKLDDHGNITKLAGIRKFIIQALQKLAKADKVNEIMENYEARGATPCKDDMVMGQKIGKKMAELVNEGVTGGKAVVYFDGMDPLTEDPVVVDLVGVSDKNNLANPYLYPEEVLQENGVLIVKEDLGKYLQAA